MPTQKRAKSSITRSGARRLGDEYQDLVALDVLVEWLGHSDRYEWVLVEADAAGALDDVVARRRDGTVVYRQSKFAVHPDQVGALWTWKALLKQATSAKGQPLTSLLQDWAASLQRLLISTPSVDAALYTNRQAAYEIRQACHQEDATLLDFAQLPDAAREKITTQLGGEEGALLFFQHFHFLFNQPHLPDLEEALKRRFFNLGGTPEGWLSLKTELRSWVCHRDKPPPDGYIRLADVRRAALWDKLEGLAQEFAVPDDYVPPQTFLRRFVRYVLQGHASCIVLTGSPGIGKSTFISYLYQRFREKQIPVVRHHYDLGNGDHAPGFRLNHLRAARSLMHDLARDHAQALGPLANRNPQPEDLRTWLSACGAHYAREGRVMTVLLDGLDHVWHERQSLEELTLLLEYLLPPPNGVVLVFATQPVDDRQLPPILLRHAPRDRWLELPQLDQTAVEQWVCKHSADFAAQAEQLQSAVFTRRLARALYRKGHGHPLHLYYTLKAIQERTLAFTEETIEALPGCPHEGITAYYAELWRVLPEGSQAIIHLFAATQFPWPSQGIVACLDPQRQQIAHIRDDLRQVRHLLVQDDLGLLPFHSSLFAFVTSLPEHQEYRIPHRQKALFWLCQEAPDYWRWAYTWEIEASLGDDTPLSQGPDRRWVVDALAARRPSRDITGLLHSSMERTLEHADLPRLVELGLLHDYSVQACEAYRDIREQLLYAQLWLEDDPHLSAWLFADLDDMTDGELVLLAEQALVRRDRRTFNRCRRLASVRLLPGRKQREDVSSLPWQQRHTPQLALAAMSDDVHGVSRTLDFAVRNRGNHTISQEILSLYCEHLRIWRNTDHMQTLLAFPVVGMQGVPGPQEGIQLTVKEAMLLRRHATLLALEEGLELDELLSSATDGDPFSALYAAIRRQSPSQPGVIRLPDRNSLDLQWHEAYERPFEMREAFYQAFFGFLANHLYGHGERNGAWLHESSARTWALRFLQELNACAAVAAMGLQSSAPMTLGAFFANLSRATPPSFEESERYEEGNRTALEYYKRACDAAVEIGLDLVILAGSIPYVTQADLVQTLSSPYCDLDTFLQRVISRRRPMLEDTAIQWLLDEQEASSRIAIVPCAERAKRFALLSALAVLHDKTEAARRAIARSTEHLLAHAYHKDVVFYNVLSTIQRYAQAVPPPKAQTICWPWLAQLAPAIAGILDYTDGDETRSLAVELADTLALVAPEQLPAYSRWQYERGDQGQALSTLHAFLEHADLLDPIAHSLAMTAIDRVSLGIIARRAAQGDAGAQAIQARQQASLGAAFALTTSRTEERVPDLDGAVAFDPSAYPPAAFDASLEDLPGPVTAWIDYWTANGQKREVYRVLAEADAQGVDLACYDRLFALGLALYGKAKAYPWLVKAHIRGNGWNWYMSHQDEAEQRWRMIKQHYPDRWQTFLQDTLLQMPLWRSGSFSHMEFRRLIEYCLFMGQGDLSKRLVEEMVNRSLELVSMLPLPTPEWVGVS